MVIAADVTIPNESVTKEAVRPKIALVLGGGGAKGAAHIGILSILEKNNVPIDIVVGTSIGSYVGGLVALGYNAQEIKSFMFSTQWEKGFSDFISREDLLYEDKKMRDKYNLTLRIGYRDGKFKLPGGLLIGQSALQVLNESTGTLGRLDSFDNLPVPYRAVATNLVTAKPVVLDSGDLTLAMKASSSIPGALEPTRIDGKMLVDGGVSNNLPVDVARAMGADIIIAVDIGAPLTSEENLQSTVGVLGQLSTIMTITTTEAQKKNLTEEDILLLPDVRLLNTANFSILTEAYEKGVESANDDIDRLKALSVSDEEYERYTKKKQLKRDEWEARLALPVTNIVYDNDSFVEDALIAYYFSLKVGDVITPEQVSEAIDRVYALDRFELVTVEFNDTKEGRILTLITRGQAWGPNYLKFGLGLRGNIHGESELEVNFGYILMDVTRNGGMWKNEARAGWENGISTEFYQPLDEKQHFFSKARIEYNEENYLKNDGKGNGSSRSEIFRSYLLAKLGVGLNNAEYGFSEIGSLAEFGHIEQSQSVDTVNYRTLGAYISFGFDGLNSINLPTKGHKTSFNFYFRNDELDNAINPSVVGHGNVSVDSLEINLNWRGAFEIGSHSLVGLSSFVTVLTDDEDNIVHLTSLGGFLNLSGYQRDALVGNNKGFAAVVYQYDLGREAAGSPLYLGGSLEAGNVWKYVDDISLTHPVTSGSLFLGTDTTFGPAIIGLGYATTLGNRKDEAVVFFSLGKNW